jgi:hypothetical protein
MKNTNQLLTYGMLGVAGYFLLKSYSGTGSSGSAGSLTGSTGGGSFTSAPILDSFNSVVNTSSPTYKTQTTYNVAPVGASGDTTKKEEKSSASSDGLTGGAYYVTGAGGINEITLPSGKKIDNRTIVLPEGAMNISGTKKQSQIGNVTRTDLAPSFTAGTTKKESNTGGNVFQSIGNFFGGLFKKK